MCLGASTLALIQGAATQAQVAQDPVDGAAGATSQSDAIVVTGSRIARRPDEGAAPVTILTGDAIDKSGFRSVFDALTALPQNTGYVQGEDFGSTFTPAANFVNLRGLGPNHSLVLVNGRRLAD
jgi:outer membrane cobalamin receptor